MTVLRPAVGGPTTAQMQEDSLMPPRRNLHPALPAERVFLRPLTGMILMNSSGRTQGGGTCNLAVRPTRPSLRDPSMEISVRSTGQGQDKVGLMQFVLRHSRFEETGKLLQSLSPVIPKTGIMMQTLGFHSVIH